MKILPYKESFLSLAISLRKLSAFSLCLGSFQRGKHKFYVINTDRDMSIACILKVIYYTKYFTGSAITRLLV